MITFGRHKLLIALSYFSENMDLGNFFGSSKLVSLFFKLTFISNKTRPYFDQGSIRMKYLYQLGRLERISYFKS